MIRGGDVTEKGGDISDKGLGLIHYGKRRRSGVE